MGDASLALHASLAGDLQSTCTYRRGTLLYLHNILRIRFIDCMTVILTHSLSRSRDQSSRFATVARIGLSTLLNFVWPSVKYGLLQSRFSSKAAGKRSLAGVVSV